MGWVAERYERAIAEIQPQIYNYKLNHEFFEGNQWMWINRATGRVESHNDPDRLQATMNRIRLNLRSSLSEMMQRPLVFESMPTMADDASMEAARLAESICYDLHSEHRWHDLRRMLLLAVLKGGTAAIVLDWDEDAQESRESVLDISQFALEPGASSADDARWWIKSQIFPPGVVKSMFDLDEPASALGNDAENYVFGGQVSTAGVQVLTYYERPNASQPDGWFAIEVGGDIVQDGKWPFSFKDSLNIEVLVETPINGRWFGSTYLTDARRVQVAYNAVWSNFLEHMRDAGASKLLVRSSMFDMVENMTDIPGATLEVPDGVDPPAYLTPPQLGGWLFRVLEELRSELDDIMSRHDVSRGVAPANIDSGVGVSILADNDSGVAVDLLGDMTSLFERLCRKILSMCEKYVTKKRTATVDNGFGPEGIEWTGKDILGQTNVRVPRNEIIPRSRAAMQQFAQTALQMNLITDLVDFVRLADSPNQESMLATVSPAVAKARRMVHELVTGPVDSPPLPAAFDDSEMMIRMLNEFRMSVRYDQLDIERQRNVDDFVQAHENQLAEKLGKRAAQSQISPALAQSPTADNAPVVDPAAEQAAAAAGQLPPQGAPSGSIPDPGAAVVAPPPDPAVVAEQQLQALLDQQGGA